LGRHDLKPSLDRLHDEVAGLEQSIEIGFVENLNAR
jgi:hypothetical protein